MGVLSFIASVIKSLAWPGLILFLGWYFKDPLIELLLSVSRFRYKDLEVDFGKKIREVEATAERTLPTTADVKARVAPNVADQTSDVAKIDPSAAVLVAWRQLERTVRTVALRENLPPTWPLPVVVSWMEVAKRIDRRTHDIFNELLRLRNQAAHPDGAGITESEAIEFGDLAMRLAAKIDES